MLGQDLLAKPLERQPPKRREPLVALEERAAEPRVARRKLGGTVFWIPAKSGRLVAARRMSTSPSFEMPTSGEASTVTSASSS